MAAPYFTPAERAECFGPWAERDSVAAAGTGFHVEVQRLPLADGGGFVATVPELPGCMSDGETVGEARANAADAIGCWLAAARRRYGETDFAKFDAHEITDEEYEELPDLSDLTAADLMSGLAIVPPEEFDGLLEMLGHPPEISEELRRSAASRRWR